MGSRKMSIHGGETMARIGIVVATCLFCFACAHVEPPKEPPKLVKPVDIPSPIVPQVEKERSAKLEGPKELFSFSLREADLKDVLRGIAKQSSYNVVVEPDVKGTSTVDLKNVTLSKALDYILEPLNYVYKIDGNTIYVSKPKLETKVFSINYAAFSKLTESIVTGSSGTQRSGALVVGVNMRTRSDMDAWLGFQDTLKNLLSADGKLTLNRQAGLVSVTDYPRNLKQIGAFIKSMDESIQRQVMIEARVVEVDLTGANREGVNWYLLNSQLNGVGFTYRQQFVDPSVSQNTGGNFSRLLVAAKHLVGSDTRGLDATFVDLLKQQGKVNTLSQPKISTLNNQRAVIKVATDRAVFETTSTISVGGVPTYSTQIRYITIGLVLDVVPYVDDQGNIVMNIHPMLTQDTGQVTVDKTTGNTVPVLNVREVDTSVRVKEGEMVVLGGLISETKNESTNAIPGISTVPFLGWPFRSWSKNTDRTELVIFLTPKVVYAKDPT
jgi:MSHA biogenesis protein MshL